MARAAFAGVALGLAFGCGALLGIDDVGYGPFAEAGEAGGGDGGLDQDGNILCAPNLTGCGNTCVSLQSNDKNCGRCGYDCGGGLCENATCKEFILAAGLAGPHGVAIDNGYAYVTLFGIYGFDGMRTPGSVVRIPITGGKPETLQANQAEPAFILARTGLLVWTTRTGIRSSFVDGGGLSVVDDAGPHFGITEGAAGEVYAIGVNATTCTLIRWLPGSATSLAIPAPCGRMILRDGNLLYWTNVGSAISSLAINQLPDAAISTIGDPTAATWGITQDKDRFYYAHPDNDPFLAELRAIDKDGGKETTLQRNFAGPRVVVVDDQYAYVSDFQRNRVDRIPLDGSPDRAPDGAALEGGSPTVELGGGSGPNGMALADGFLYWVNFGDVNTTNLDGTLQTPGSLKRIRVR
jgi:hypothetical protein